MPTVSDIQAVHITLETGDKQSLFILIASDGTINRLGTGTVNNKDNDLFIGISHEPLFNRLMAHIDDRMLMYLGAYEIPQKLGVSSKLSIGFCFANAKENGYVFSYGSKSQGPPQEIVEFVKAAVELTDPWFHQQKQMVATSPNKEDRPWWKFW